MTNTELEACIAEYGTAIYSFCRQLTQNTQEADDLYQDTFLKAMELSSKINQTQNPKSYLLSIALRLWKNKKRKHAWRKQIASMVSITEESDLDLIKAAAFTPETSFLQREESDLVRRAVGNLPEKLKITVLLFYMEDLSVTQISHILKIPAGTVKSRLHHARNQLKKELEVVLDEKYR